MSSKTTTKKTAPKKTTSKEASTPKPASKKPAPKQDHEIPSDKETTNNARLDAHAAKSAPKATTPRKPAKDATRANVGGNAGGNVGALKRPSGLDLAAKALAESKEPMTAKALADRVIAAGWQTTGRTPEATLYSAIIREIANKGKDSRFVKASRGLFSARKGA